MYLLATTNGGLEFAALGELTELCGIDAAVHHRGVVAFEATREDVYELHARSRTLHRIMLVLTDDTAETLADVYDLTRRVHVGAHLPYASFGVVGTRHGSHEFTSVDVAERVGQATIDAYRAATGDRLPVDLDDPTVRLEAYLYDDRFTLAVDLTGESMHRRPYRVCEHDAPLRPTMAAALLGLSGYDPGDRLIDPTCGSATIPIEAALAATDRLPRPDLDPAFAALPGFDAAALCHRRTAHEPTDRRLDVEGRDRSERWLRCGRINRDAAGLEGAIDLTRADATEAAIDADRVVANLPFGVRTSEDLRALYGGLTDRLEAGRFRRAVFLTTKPELLELDPAERYDVPYGRLEASIVVFE